MKAKHRWRLTGGSGCLVRTLTTHEYQRFKDTGLLPDVGAVSDIASGLGVLAAHHKNITADST